MQVLIEDSRSFSAMVDTESKCHKNIIAIIALSLKQSYIGFASQDQVFDR